MTGERARARSARRTGFTPGSPFPSFSVLAREIESGNCVFFRDRVLSANAVKAWKIGFAMRQIKAGLVCRAVPLREGENLNG